MNQFRTSLQILKGYHQILVHCLVWKCISFVLVNVLKKQLKNLKDTLTHLFPMPPFSNPWKHQKTVRFSDIFKGYKMSA